MKKKKILGLALAGVTALTGGFMLAGCDLKKDDSTPPAQEQETPAEKTISGISISSSAVPKYIVKGRFDQAKIKAMVTYSDNSFEYINVTEDMLSNADKAKVQTAGTHSVAVTYEGKTETINVKIVTEIGLLQELANDLFEKDFVGNGVEAESAGDVMWAFSYDAESGIMKTTQSTGYTSYIWENASYVYDIDSVAVEDSQKTLYKYQTELIDYLMGHFAMPEDAFNATGQYSNPQVAIDNNTNYVYTVTFNEEGDIYTYKFTYDTSNILSIQVDGDEGYTTTLTFDTDTSVNLNVPDNYKALESRAVEG